MINFRDRVLPEQIFLGNFRSQISLFGSHIPVDELKPCSGKDISKFSRILIKSFRNLFVLRICFQGKIRGEHHRCIFLR